MSKDLRALAKAIAEGHEGLITLVQVKNYVRIAYELGLQEGRIHGVIRCMTFDEWWDSLQRRGLDD